MISPFSSECYAPNFPNFSLFIRGNEFKFFIHGTILPLNFPLYRRVGCETFNGCVSMDSSARK